MARARVREREAARSFGGQRRGSLSSPRKRKTHPSALVSGRAWKPNGLFLRHALRSSISRPRATPDMALAGERAGRLAVGFALPKGVGGASARAQRNRTKRRITAPRGEEVGVVVLWLLLCCVCVAYSGLCVARPLHHHRRAAAPPPSSSSSGRHSPRSYLRRSSASRSTAYARCTRKNSPSAEGDASPCLAANVASGWRSLA